MINTINIEKEHIQFGDTILQPPFIRDKVDAILGKPRIEESDIEIDKNRFVHHVTYYWDELGIISSADKLNESYSNFIIYLGEVHTKARNIDVFFTGQLLINGKDYREAAFKPEKYGMCHEKKLGPFKINTILADHLDELESAFIDEWMTKEVEITYKAPRPKSSIYDLKKPEGPTLKFDSYPFKLIVIEELMYRRGLISPAFDIYDFATKNPKREIDVDSEGYDIIPEAKKWFQDFQIPEKLASEITELIWDGGLEVFHQIYPFWDGEDNIFDVKKLSAEEVKQFTCLRKVITGGGFAKKAIDLLKYQGIEVSDV